MMPFLIILSLLGSIVVYPLVAGLLIARVGTTDPRAIVRYVVGNGDFRLGLASGIWIVIGVVNGVSAIAGWIIYCCIKEAA